MSSYITAGRPPRDTPLPGDAQHPLHHAGLRSTKQRIGIARLLFRGANRRVTAEILYNEAREARCPISRSAVCDALRQFEHAGLLNRISIDRSKRSWFVVANTAVDLS
jgi:Fe2+ or Zn2+ uptake regulation protein